MSSVEVVPKEPKFPLTVFAFGTGDKIEMKEKNILSHFSENCDSNKLIIEGPTLLGLEVGPNASLAAEKIIENLNNTDDLEKYTVNLTGLSRGAVTCIRIANLLQDKLNALNEKLKNKKLTNESLSADEEKLRTKLSKLELNIFNIDPVAGMGAKQYMESRIIPANVTNYTVILQLDEMRRDFKPQDITRTIIESPKKTHVSWLPLYGNHTHATKIKDTDTQSTALITHNALYSFLTNHGTTFEEGEMPPIAFSSKVQSKESNFKFNSQTPSCKDLLTLCEMQHTERDAYLAYGIRSKLADSGFLRAPRSMNQHKEYYVTDSNFFVNQLERELFKVTYPRVFNYLFELNKQTQAFPSGSKDEEVIAELKTLKAAHKLLFKRLVEFEKLETTKTRSKDGKILVKLGKPKGSAYIEPCQTLQQLYPNLLPETVTAETTAQSCEILKLKAEIIGVTSYYDREKACYATFDKRSRSDLTQAIRDEICKIVEDREDRKTQRMLDVVKKHAEFLQLADNNSDLLPLLKDDLLPLLTKILTEHHQPLDQLPDDGLLTSGLITFIDVVLTLLKKTIYLIGSMGFVLGFGLSMLGTFMEDLGRRANDVIGTIGYNPFKLLASMVAITLEVTGCAVKNHFGLKPIVTLVTDGIQQVRDESIVAIRNYKQKLSDIKVPTSDPDADDAKKREVISAPERISL